MTEGDRKKMKKIDKNYYYKRKRLLNNLIDCVE